jgi:Na+-transporting NADH:ubiquinone oxidoreductase subunit NqrA
LKILTKSKEIKMPEYHFVKARTDSWWSVHEYKQLRFEIEKRRGEKVLRGKIVLKSKYYNQVVAHPKTSDIATKLKKRPQTQPIIKCTIEDSIAYKQFGDYDKKSLARPFSAKSAFTSYKTFETPRIRGMSNTPSRTTSPYFFEIPFSPSSPFPSISCSPFK